MTKKTQEELRQLEQAKESKRLAEGAQKAKSKHDEFMSHFKQVSDIPHEISDRYTQLEHVLGNIHKFTDRGFSTDGKLHPGDEFFIFIKQIFLNYCRRGFLC